jgi:multidrug efflux system membrane fusion protein
MRSPLVAHVILSTLASLLGACGNGAPPAAPVRPALVEAPQPLAEGTSEVFPGAVRAQVETELSFRVPGKIATRRVEAGAEVKAGQVLATLDPNDARLNLEAARADQALAESDALRFHDLKRKGFASQSQVENADNQLKLANAKLSLAENQSRYTELKADGDGVVTAVLAEAGETVAAGRPVFRFAAAGAREVLINVPEGRVDSLRSAERIGVTLWSQPGKVYTGRIRVITPAADAQTRTHEVRISMTDADAAVQLGTTATVHVGGKSGAPTFRLPASALGDAGKDQPRVWVVRGKPPTAQPVPVKVLEFLHEMVIVSGDLHADDQLITAGVHLLTPGMAVQPVARSAPAAL